MTTTNIQIKRDEKAWEIEVKAEITPESLEKYRTEALAELQKTAKLDGFRPGKVPQDKIVHMYGEDVILRQSLPTEPRCFGSSTTVLVKPVTSST